LNALANRFATQQVQFLSQKEERIRLQDMVDDATHSVVLQEAFHGNGNGCDGVEAIQSAILKVLTRVTRFQVRVQKHIDDNYTEFMPNHTSPDIFLEESASLTREILDLLETVGTEGLSALEEANDKLAKSERQLREILLGLAVSEHVLKIDELFQCVEDAKAIKDYLVILDLVSRLRAFIYGDDARERDGGSPVASQEVRRVFQVLECYETISAGSQRVNHLLTVFGAIRRHPHLITHLFFR